MQMISKLERDLGAIFGPAPRKRRAKAEAPAPRPNRFVVRIGGDETPTHEAQEIGRYPTYAEALAAQRAYNDAHDGEDLYAWAPAAL